MEQRNPYDPSYLLGIVKKTIQTSAGRKVYLVNPARITNDEAEGTDITYEKDSDELIPVHLASSAGPADGDLVVGIPLAPRLMSVSGVGKPPPPKGQLCVNIGGCNQLYNLPLNGARVNVSKVSVDRVIIDDGGSGFRDGKNYNIYFFGGYTSIGSLGKSAVGIFDVVNGAVANPRVTYGGMGYVTLPTMSFLAAGNGTGVVAHATLKTEPVGSGVTGSSLSTVRITNAQSNGPYTNIPPKVIIDDPPAGGVPPIATALLSGGNTDNPTLIDGGMDYTSMPAVVVKGGGSGVSPQIYAYLGISDVRIDRPGYGGVPGTYPLSAENVPTPVGDYTIGANGSISYITITDKTRNFTNVPRLAFPGGGISGVEATARMTVNRLYVSFRGTLYYNPTIEFQGGGGSGARATITASIIRVAGVALAFSGNGYQKAPNVAIEAPPSGITATAKAELAVNGVCIIVDDKNGTYKLDIDPPPSSHWGGFTANYTAGYSQQNLFLGPAAGWSCLPDRCCPADPEPGPPYRMHQYEDTYYLNDGFGTFPVNRKKTSSYRMWIGCASRPCSLVASDCSDQAIHDAGPGDVTLLFIVMCTGIGLGWDVTIYCPGCGGGASGFLNCPAAQLLPECGGTWSAFASIGLYDGGVTVLSCDPLYVEWHLKSVPGVRGYVNPLVYGDEFTVLLST